MDGSGLKEILDMVYGENTTELSFLLDKVKIKCL